MYVCLNDTQDIKYIHNLIAHINKALNDMPLVIALIINLLITLLGNL